MMKPETLAIHGPQTLTYPAGDVTMPLSLSTTFLRGADGGYPGGYMYSRVNNPNRQALELLLSSLEGGEGCCAFASGNTAGMTVFQALKPGSHIIAPDDMYWGFKKQLLTIFDGILSFDFIDLTKTDEISQYVNSNTVLLWAETPSNPLLKICDIAELAKICKKHQLIFACDNTFASPCMQNPISLGANIVMHSTTKYIGGHSDVLGGALITAKADAFWEKIVNIQQTGGAVPSPFDCFLLIRSIKTLSYRMRGHCENAEKLASYLEKHNGVEAVFYPGLPSHPQHAIAKKQMKSFGGMLSVLIEGGEDSARRVVNNMQLFAQATSLGGVESLIEHRFSVEGPTSTTPKNLLRVSVGLEHIDDLIADFAQALDKNNL